MVWTMDGDVEKWAEYALSYFDEAGLYMKAQLFFGESVVAKRNGLGEIVTPIEC